MRRLSVKFNLLVCSHSLFLIIHGSSHQKIATKDWDYWCVLCVFHHTLWKWIINFIVPCCEAALGKDCVGDGMGRRLEQAKLLCGLKCFSSKSTDKMIISCIFSLQQQTRLPIWNRRVSGWLLPHTLWHVDLYGSHYLWRWCMHTYLQGG